MGNCKSVSAASRGATVQRPEGYDSIKAPKRHDDDTAPLIRIDTSVGKSNQTAMLDDVETELPMSPTADMSEASDKNGPISVDDWIGTKPTVSIDEGEEDNNDENKYLRFNPNSKATENDGVESNDDAPDEEKAADEKKEEKEESENQLIKAGPPQVAPAFQLTIPIFGKIPSSMFKMASDYVTSEFNAMTVGSQTEPKSAWALHPKDIVPAASASVAPAASTNGAKQTDAKTVTLPSAPSGEVEVEVEEVDLDSVIVSYKQKESQWAIDEAVKPKRRGPRPEDVGRRSSTGTRSGSAKKTTKKASTAPMPVTPSRKTRAGSTRNSSEKKRRVADPLDFMANW